MCRIRGSLRPGTTLIELLVVLAVLGIILSFVTSAMGSQADRPSDTTLEVIATARRRAIETGRPVTLLLRDSIATRPVRAEPDGSVLGASPFGVDWLSGRPRHDRR